MTVGKIAFSGIMAAILMGATGANAAVEIASKQYVVKQTEDKATKTEVSEGLATKADKTAFETLQSAVNSTTDGLATKASAAALAETNAEVAKKANAADVYTKDEADELLATKADVDKVYEKTETYTRQEVKDQIDATLTGISGGTINLTGYAKTADVADAISTAKTYTDDEIAKLSAEGGVVKANADAISALETKVGTNDVATQISNAITELDLGNTYESKGEAAKAQAAAASYTDEKVAALSGEGGAITALAARVTTNEDAISENAGKITTLEGQVATNTGAIATKVETATYNAKVQELEGSINAKVAQTDYDTKVASLQSGIDSKVSTETYNADVKTLTDELATKIAKPAECDTGNCVLAMLNGGDPEWVVLTLPTE